MPARGRLRSALLIRCGCCAGATTSSGPCPPDPPARREPSGATVSDPECVVFLRWALPRLGMRWPGFRRVRRQVCKRIGRRIRELALRDAEAYRAYLESVPEEWTRLDSLCRITISRLYRDRAVFDHLGEAVLPALAAAAVARGESTLRCWSAGCASGEEPYSLVLLWAFRVGPTFPGLAFAVVATDADEHLLARAARGCYPRGALRELPAEWVRSAFAREHGSECLRPAFRQAILFLRQDIRLAQPDGPFDLVLCRNLAFTYFDAHLQRRVLMDIAARMRPGAALVLGKGEKLPATDLLEPSLAGFGVYRKGEAPSLRGPRPARASAPRAAGRTSPEG
jgi:chemotaxis protein methyltransferase CheR